ncbi:MAG TPA: hypothetical protein VEK10_12410 [Steroidobacteraceae bacterium]|nr:hypothetical protein [Steroidobacteraceae bacterium]
MSNLTIKDLPHNEEMNSDDMAAIDGGISFPSILHGGPIKLIPPPQPVTRFDVGGQGLSGGTLSHSDGEQD